MGSFIADLEPPHYTSLKAICAKSSDKIVVVTSKIINGYNLKDIFNSGKSSLFYLTVLEKYFVLKKKNVQIGK